MITSEDKKHILELIDAEISMLNKVASEICESLSQVGDLMEIIPDIAHKDDIQQSCKDAEQAAREDIEKVKERLKSVYELKAKVIKEL